MKDDCDKVAETLWTVAALLRKADAAQPQTWDLGSYRR